MMFKRMVLYTTGCPLCKTLKRQLDNRGIKYEESDSIEEMKKLGIDKVPVLFNGEKLLNFIEATEWLNKK